MEPANWTTAFPAKESTVVVAHSSVAVAANAPIEDGVLVEHPLSGGSGSGSGAQPPSLFVVIDGHGGAATMTWLLANLPTLTRQALEGGKAGVEALAAVMERAEMQILAQDALADSGACIVAVLFTPGAPKAEQLAVVSIGDCRVVAGVLFEHTLQAQRLSGVPHNCGEPTELLKALQSPGQVSVEVVGEVEEDPENATFYLGDTGGRESMQCTRSLGDANFKTAIANGGGGGKKRKSLAKTPVKGERRDSLASARPTNKLTDVEDTAFVVLATDGITDFLSDGEIVDIVGRHVAAGKPREEAAAALQQRALQCAAFKNPPLSIAEVTALPAGDARREVLDDMSAVVVFFR